MNEVVDLNKLDVFTSGELASTEPVAAAQVSVHFRDLETKLCNYIRKADAVVGCVAWLTNKAILEALVHVPNLVSIVVQKEDFLRPDAAPVSKRHLRKMYDLVNNTATGRYDQHQIDGLYGLCYAMSFDPAGIRCVGNVNNGPQTSPRMHNKFLVFCRKTAEPFKYKPTAVWTGSFNFTYNAGKSLENAVHIAGDEIAQSYYNEWAQIFALSESLDWETKWIEPEYRIGS